MMLIIVSNKYLKIESNKAVSNYFITTEIYL